MHLGTQAWRHSAARGALAQPQDRQRKGQPLFSQAVLSLLVPHRDQRHKDQQHMGPLERRGLLLVQRKGPWLLEAWRMGHGGLLLGEVGPGHKGQL